MLLWCRYNFPKEHHYDALNCTKYNTNLHLTYDNFLLNSTKKVHILHLYILILKIGANKVPIVRIRELFSQKADLINNRAEIF